MPGRVDGAGEQHAGRVTTAELKKQRDAYERQLHDAILVCDGSISSKARVAQLQEQLWNQVALVNLSERDLDGAAKASREAVRHGELAVKLAKSQLADRVAALERIVAEGKRKGQGIADEAKRRRG